MNQKQSHTFFVATVQYLVAESFPRHFRNSANCGHCWGGNHKQALRIWGWHPPRRVSYSRVFRNLHSANKLTHYYSSKGVGGGVTHTNTYLIQSARMGGHNSAAVAIRNSWKSYDDAVLFVVIPKWPLGWSGWNLWSQTKFVAKPLLIRRYANSTNFHPTDLSGRSRASTPLIRPAWLDRNNWSRSPDRRWLGKWLWAA